MQRSDVQAVITRAWERVLGFAPGPDQNVFDAGADSLAVVRLAGHLIRVGLPVPIELIYRHPTVAALESAVARLRCTSVPVGDGAMPLLPAQARFFESNPDVSPSFTTGIWLRAQRRLDPTQLSEAVSKLVDRHDALRMRLARARGMWTQSTQSDPEPVVVSHCRAGARLRSSDYLEIDAANRSALDVEHGPVIAVTYVQRPGDGNDLLALAVHHLAIDLVSWGVLVADLASAYEFPDVRAGSTSLRRWVLGLASYASSEALRTQAQSWTWLPSGGEGGWPRQHATASGNGSYATGTVVEVSVPAAKTRGLMRRAQSAGGVVPMLLTALHNCDANAGEPLAVNVTHHGRVPLLGMNIASTIGPFVSVFPVGLPSTGASARRELSTVSTLLRQITDGGVGYGVLRYMSDASVMTGAGVQPEVAINYLGVEPNREDTDLFETIDAPKQPGYRGDLSREHLLYLTVAVTKGRLRMGWGFSPDHLNPRKVESLARRFASVLTSL